MIKRALDIAVSGLALVLLSPLFALIAVWIILDSPGPVIFSQARMGRGFRPFQIRKFRTMREDRDRDRAGISFSGAPVTQAGATLRKWKLDELPQLWNVLAGDMSLVGSRPEVPRYAELFRADYEEILRLRPGITDPASLEYRNEEALLSQTKDPELEYRTKILPDKIRLAKAYVSGRSFLGDLVILVRTLRGVLGGKG